MSDELMSAMRRYGAAMADATANDPPGQQACYGTVNSVSGATMAVSVKGASLKLRTPPHAREPRQATDASSRQSARTPS